VTSRFDAVVVGGGHNGLTCAAYLAAAGMTVCVVERRSIVGGAAVTEEFHPGFRNSTASYTVSLLDPRVILDLRLAQHGLVVRERPFANFLPLPDGNYLKVGAASKRRKPRSPGFRSAMRTGCPRITPCSSASPTRCASCCTSRRRISAARASAMSPRSPK